MSFNVDFGQVKEQSFNCLPVGDYNLVSDDAMLKESKSGGEYVSIKFRVLDGPYAGRFIFQSFTTRNVNEKAVAIGLAQLKQFIICAGAKIEKTNDVLDFVGHKVAARVKIRTSEEYGDQNTISYFKELKQDPTKQDLPF